jgi:Ni/Co efflux regulator RcnB
MKTRWWITACAVTLFALSGSVARSQDRGQDNRNQNRQDHTKFDDHDRQVASDWYKQNRGHAPVGFRDRDRLAPEHETRLQMGIVLDKELRGRMHALPSDLSRRFPAAPRGYRYIVIGGHVVLVDKGYHVQDVIRLDIRL